MTPLDHLFQAARGAAPQRDEDAPFGFATRVVAAWHAQPAASPWALLTLRAIGFASVLLLTAAVSNAWPGGDPATLDPDIVDAVPDVLFIP
jgi:hypothetical protein